MCVSVQRGACEHPGGIPQDSPFSEVVEFEIPSFEDAARLCLSLAANWFTWVYSYEGLSLVVVLLVPHAEDLAPLLRTVQEWGRQQGNAIPFELDGRRYLLGGWNAPRTNVAA